MDNNREVIMGILERNGDKVSEDSLNELTEVISELNYKIFESEELLDDIRGTLVNVKSNVEDVTDKIGINFYLNTLKDENEESDLKTELQTDLKIG